MACHCASKTSQGLAFPCPCRGNKAMKDFCNSRPATPLPCRRGGGGVVGFLGADWLSHLYQLSPFPSEWLVKGFKAPGAGL